MIYLIITTSINSFYGTNHLKNRTERYIECIKSTLKIIEQNNHNIKPIIVENNDNSDTFLNNLGCDVIYTNNNKYKHPHKGVNELLDIQHVIQTYNINDDDVIIKLTGRYKMMDDSFINIVKHNTHDAFVKFFNVCTLKNVNNDCVLGMFAIKCKYLKQFTYTCKKSAECDFAEYVRSIPNINIMEITNLNLECCFNDNLRILCV
jgi:hypothetical protein